MPGNGLNARMNMTLIPGAMGSTSFFKDSNSAKHMSYLRDKYVVSLTNKAQKNIVGVCKSDNGTRYMY